MSKNKKAAMEMSMGTIVTVVLSMALLIGGIMLIRNITKSSGDVIGMTDEQVKNQINQMFGSDSRVEVYPSDGAMQVKIGKEGAFAIGIRNLLTGQTGQNAEFDYDVVVADSGNCGISESTIMNWVVLGKSEKNIYIPQSETHLSRVRLSVPQGSPLCTFRLKINVRANGNNYMSTSMDIQTI